VHLRKIYNLAVRVSGDELDRLKAMLNH
jgi:hypothetical protein